MKDIFEQNLNKLLISPKEVIEPYCGGYSTCWEPTELIDLLLADTANYLFVSKWESDFFKIEEKKLPKIFQKRLIIVDKNKKQFKKIQTIIKEIDENISKSDSDIKNGTVDFHLNNVFKFLYNFHLGIEYQCDIDFSPYRYRLEESLNYLIKKCERKDIPIYLKQVSRFYNLYSTKKFNFPIYLRDDTKNSSIMLTRLLEDSNYISTSRWRNNLASSWDLQRITELNIAIKRFALGHPKILKIGQMACILLPEQGQKLVKSLSELFDMSSQFCPAIVDTDLIIFNSIKRDILSSVYNKKTLEKVWTWKEIEKKWFDEGPGNYIGPVDAYSFARSSIHRIYK